MEKDDSISSPRLALLESGRKPPVKSWKDVKKSSDTNSSSSDWRSPPTWRTKDPLGGTGFKNPQDRQPRNYKGRSFSRDSSPTTWRKKDPIEYRDSSLNRDKIGSKHVSAHLISAQQNYISEPKSIVGLERIIRQPKGPCGKGFKSNADVSDAEEDIPKKDEREGLTFKGITGRTVMRRKEGSAEPTLDDRNYRRATEERPDKIQPAVSSRAKFVRFRAPLGHFRLEEMAKLDPNEIVEIVANKHSGFMELLGGDTSLRPDMVALVVKILARLSLAPFHEIKTNMMALSCRQEFLDQLKTFLSDLPTGDRHHQSTENAIFEDLFTFYKCVLEMLPNTACDVFRSLFLCTDMSIKGVEMYQEVNIKVDLKNTFNALQECLKDTIREKDMKKETHVEYPEPPNNFREMSVVPTHQDITSEKSSFVRPNITKGAYSDVEHYLDVQFRLLREDFIGPLREGILEYLNNTEENTVLTKASNLRFYNKVLFLTTKSTKDGIGVVVNFDPDKRRWIENWKDSKKFMYGTLLVFTSDNFKSTIIATVIEREEKLLKKNRLVVKFHSSTKIDKNLFKKVFIMAESEVYFNSYNHVLHGLQTLRKENFPMKEYIVDVNCICKPPLYVDVEREFSFEGFKIHPTDVDSWPGFKALGLNPAQYDALIAATTREFVVIQGPPGTGKTFLGLKVVDFLLQNTPEWNMQGQPILIVCHTNHALDQFLEGIARISDSIVRIGGQSKSEILQKYNLKEIRRITKKNSHNYYLSKDINNTMANLTSKIQRKQERLELIKKNEGILWMDYFVDRNIIPCGFLDVLRTSLVEWLLVPLEEWPEEEEELDNEAQQFHEQENPEESHTENVVSELHYTLLDELLEDVRYDDTDSIFHDREETYGISLEMLDYTKEDIYEISLEKLNDQLKKIEGILKDPKDGGYSDRNLWFFDTLYDDFTYQKKCLKTCLSQVIPNDEERVKKLVTESDVWQIDPRDRWLLYKHWLSLLEAELLEDLIGSGEDFTENLSFYEEARNMSDLRILREHHVVGMTTTGAARLQPLLQALRPTIGDHKQLRPSNAVYKLAREFKFDVSLFERMLNNGMHCKVLQLQHRMRPEIAELITPTIYPVLMNHSSVETYPDVKGMLKNVYFVKHNKPEAQDGESSSHSNRHEADFLLALCWYLILQGYDGEDITILTTYSGQMLYLREKRSKHLMLHNVRMTVVDNFQGEENKIILLSLVRSNKDANIGFLKTPNRVCVALSRAREGLYIIGNMDNLTERSSSIWGEINETLVRQEAIGTHLTLICQNHPDQVTLVASREDFKQVKEGGCRLPCEALLKCGHTCKSICHLNDLKHEKIKCLEPCERVLCALEHNCKKMCWEECGPCTYLLLKIPPCGHEALVLCYITLKDIVCEVMVSMELPNCKHKVDVPCGVDPLKFDCPFKCEDRLMCGHACDKTCHPLEDPEHLEVFTRCSKEVSRKDCQNFCERTLGCGHKCLDKCALECSVSRCNVLVPYDVQAACGHAGNVPCHLAKSESAITPLELLQYCEVPCGATLECGHACPGNCRACLQGRIHARCKEKCGKTLICGHRPPCNEPCMKDLRCGHPCIGFCGEPCPPLCRVCDKEEVCVPGGLSPRGGGTGPGDLARSVRRRDRYEGECIIRDLDGYISYKVCPRCKTTIARTQRYLDLVKKHYRDVTKESLSNRRDNLSSYDAETLGIQIQILEQLEDSFVSAARVSNDSGKKKLINFVDQLLKVIIIRDDYLSQQEVKEINIELQRFHRLSQMSIIESLYSFQTTIDRHGKMQDYEEAAKVLDSIDKYTGDKDVRVNQIIRDLQSILRESLEFHENERKEIVKAMGLKQGHWFKCPNGHVYVITECGGAMEVGKCNECGAAIGGTQHRLLDTNRLAREMDNASHAAWSDTANMENYALDAE
uniref:RZ-type domain-containing protein n=1 Tax=Timema douglasi TaxID=61478 RepID=A0A7R8VNB0_TIMDO|nr:unnamed protein product [Timema douglasi]